MKRLLTLLEKSVIQESVQQSRDAGKCVHVRSQQDIICPSWYRRMKFMLSLYLFPPSCPVPDFCACFAEEEKMEKDRVFLAIDLKSFYASVECRQRALDPLDAMLVVADPSRSDKTICLAVSPALKSFGIPGRDRLYLVRQKVEEVNRKRGRHLKGKSRSLKELEAHPELALDFITATPRMALYIEYSTKIYGIYLEYVAKEDIHVYSIDEVFIDITSYIKLYRTSTHDLARKIISDIFKQTGITATAGIGTNLYLCKIAMDIMAKHIQPDENGVRIASLDEMSYRRQLWDHEPLSDFWRIGRGYEKKLHEHGMRTMGDIARTSITNEELLYRLFGVNAELLIDHAWGWENCTIEDIKAYRPSASSISQGQVLMEPYSFSKARLVLSEMADMLAFSLLSKGLVTDQITVTVGYDIANISTGGFTGKVVRDWYGRIIPAHAHGTGHLKKPTSGMNEIIKAACGVFDSVVNPALLVRRLNITACNVISENEVRRKSIQMDLFTDYEKLEKENEEELVLREKEKRLQSATLSIKERFGKNALLRLSSYEEGATARERNRQIGGHKA